MIGWPLPCALLAFALLAVSCCGLSGWPAGWRLCPCPVPVLVEAVRLCPVGGAIGGVYIKLPGNYTGRIKPLPARLAALLAVCFCRLHRRGSGGHRLAAVLACRSRWRAVFLEAAPGAFACVCLLPVGLLRWAALHGKRHGTPHGKRRRKCAGFSGPPAGRLPPVPVQYAPRLHGWPPCRRSCRRPPKISSDFSGEVFYAPGLSLASWYINAPL